MESASVMARPLLQHSLLVAAIAINFQVGICLSRQTGLRNLLGLLPDCESLQLPGAYNRPCFLGRLQHQVRLLARERKGISPMWKYSLHFPGGVSSNISLCRYVEASSITECAQNCNWVILEQLPCNSFAFDSTFKSCALAR